MKSAIASIAGALALVTPALAQTQTPTPVPASSSRSTSPMAAQRDLAASLAATLLPKDTTIALRLPRFEAAFADRLASDKRVAALEPRYPGVTKAVAAAARDEAVKAYGEAVERLQQEAAAMYRSRFTAAELTLLSGFFATPTGRMMIELSAGSSGDDAPEFEADRRRRVMAKLQYPDQQTKADLGKLIQSGLLPKMRATNPEVAALSRRRFDDVSNLVEAALPARIDATIAAFTKAKKR